MERPCEGRHVTACRPSTQDSSASGCWGCPGPVPGLACFPEGSMQLCALPASLAQCGAEAWSSVANLPEADTGPAQCPFRRPAHPRRPRLTPRTGSTVHSWGTALPARTLPPSPPFRAAGHPARMCTLNLFGGAPPKADLGPKHGFPVPRGERAPLVPTVHTAAKAQAHPEHI